MARRKARIKASLMEDICFQCYLSEARERSSNTVVQPNELFGEPGEDVEKC